MWAAAASYAAASVAILQWHSEQVKWRDRRMVWHIKRVYAMSDGC